MSRTDLICGELYRIEREWTGIERNEPVLFIQEQDGKARVLFLYSGWAFNDQDQAANNTVLIPCDLLTSLSATGAPLRPQAGMVPIFDQFRALAKKLVVHAPGDFKVGDEVYMQNTGHAASPAKVIAFVPDTDLVVLRRSAIDGYPDSCKPGYDSHFLARRTDFGKAFGKHARI